MRPADRIRVAERLAALQVRTGKMKWCRENGRSLVPKAVTEGLISEAISAVASLEVPKAKIGRNNIRTLLGNKN